MRWIAVPISRVAWNRTGGERQTTRSARPAGRSPSVVVNHLRVAHDVSRSACRRGTRSAPHLDDARTRSDSTIGEARKFRRRWCGAGGRSAAGAGGAFSQAVLLHPGVELRAGDAEETRGARAVVLRLLERLGDQIAFDAVETDAAGGKSLREPVLPACGVRTVKAYGQVLEGDQPAVAQDGGALEGVAQLAGVAGPRVRKEGFVGVAGDPGRWPADD